MPPIPLVTTVWQPTKRPDSKLPTWRWHVCDICPTTRRQ